MSRWMRVEGCLERFNPGFACHQLFAKIFMAAFDPRNTGLELDGGAVNDADADACEGDSKAWLQQAGRRLAKSLEWIQDQSTPVKVRALVVTLGPLQLLAAWLLKRAGERWGCPFSGELPTPTLDLLNPAASPVIMSLSILCRIVGQAVGGDCFDRLQGVSDSSLHAV